MARPISKRPESQERERERVRRFALDAVERKRQGGLLLLPDHAVVSKGRTRRLSAAWATSLLTMAAVVAIGAWWKTRHGTLPEISSKITQADPFLWAMAALLAILAFMAISGELTLKGEEDTPAAAMRRAQTVGVLHADHVEIWDVHGGHAANFKLPRGVYLLHVERRENFACLAFTFGDAEHRLDDVPWTPALENAIIPWNAGWSGDKKPKPAVARLA